MRQTLGSSRLPHTASVAATVGVGRFARQVQPEVIHDASEGYQAPDQQTQDPWPGDLWSLLGWPNAAAWKTHGPCPKVA